MEEKSFQSVTKKAGFRKWPIIVVFAVLVITVGIIWVILKSSDSGLKDEQLKYEDEGDAYIRDGGMYENTDVEELCRYTPPGLQKAEQLAEEIRKQLPNGVFMGYETIAEMFIYHDWEKYSDYKDWEDKYLTYVQISEECDNLPVNEDVVYEMVKNYDGKVNEYYSNLIQNKDKIGYIYLDMDANNRFVLGVREAAEINTELLYSIVPKDILSISVIDKGWAKLEEEIKNKLPDVEIKVEKTERIKGSAISFWFKTDAVLDENGNFVMTSKGNDIMSEMRRIIQDNLDNLSDTLTVYITAYDDQGTGFEFWSKSIKELKKQQSEAASTKTDDIKINKNAAKNIIEEAITDNRAELAYFDIRDSLISIVLDCPEEMISYSEIEKFVENLAKRFEKNSVICDLLISVRNPVKDLMYRIYYYNENGMMDSWIHPEIDIWNEIYKSCAGVNLPYFGEDLSKYIDYIPVSLIAENISPNGMTLNFVRADKTGDNKEYNGLKEYENRFFQYGKDYVIEKNDAGEWVELQVLPAKENKADVRYNISDFPQTEINWEEVYGQLEPGTYRIIKTVYDRFNYMEFAHKLSINFTIS